MKEKMLDVTLTDLAGIFLTSLLSLRVATGQGVVSPDCSSRQEALCETRLCLGRTFRQV